MRSIHLITMLAIDCIKDAVAPRHWNEARRDFFARFLVALLTAQTVCLTRIASLFPSKAQIASRYHRMRRFFSGFEFDQNDLAQTVIGLVRKAGAEAPFVLAFDRTEWHLGKVVVNVFLVGIVYKRVVFPLLWTILDEKGCSDSAERVALLQQAVTLLGKDKLAFVVGDREFVSTKFLEWLTNEKVSFRLRVRCNMQMTNGKQRFVAAGWIFRNGTFGKEQQLSGKRMCLGQWVNVAGMRFKNERNESEVLIVVSDVAAPLSDYGLRWAIENLFSGLKSRGFDLEATHLLHKERLSRLLSVLAIAFSWSVVVGEADAQQHRGKVPKKKGHGRRAKSGFREGLDILRSLMAPLCGRWNQSGFTRVVQFLYGT
jgi:hypothetical protein